MAMASLQHDLQQRQSGQLNTAHYRNPRLAGYNTVHATARDVRGWRKTSSTTSGVLKMGFPPLKLQRGLRKKSRIEHTSEHN